MKIGIALEGHSPEMSSIASSRVKIKIGLSWFFTLFIYSMFIEPRKSRKGIFHFPFIYADLFIKSLDLDLYS